MIAKIFKWIGIVLGSLLVIVAVFVAVMSAMGNARMTKKYDVRVEAVAIPTDSASIEQGRKWAAALCASCHGVDFSGKAVLDDPAVGFVPASNLTAGLGGAGTEFTDEDWVRVLRHGVNREGRALIVMPSMNYYYLNDEDLGSIIAYMKTLPAVDHEMGEPEMSFMGKVLLAAGAFGKNILPAESIDHQATRPSVVVPGVTVEYGGYLVRVGGCRDCHGEELSGGNSPEPGAPHAPDLTLTGAAGSWTKEIFLTSVRTREGGGMPWEDLQPLSDPELESIYLYLQSLPVE